MLKVIADIRAKGVGVFYIFAPAAEVKQIADKVTVLRDGRRLSPAIRPTNCSRSIWRGLMVGRDVAKLILTATRGCPGNRPGDRGFFRLGFRATCVVPAEEGREILGFAGLVALDGRTDRKVSVGLRPAAASSASNGKPMQFPHVDASLKGRYRLSERDRKGKGLLRTRICAST